MRFDWEAKPPAEGYLQILRNQKRQAAIQDLNESNKNFSLLKARANAENSWEKKINLVAKPKTGNCEQVTPVSREPEPRPLVVDELRKEQQLKNLEKEAMKEAAAKRREALLAQAAEMAAQKEEERAALAEKLALQRIQNEYPELKEKILAQRARELSKVWDLQLEEKRCHQLKAAPEAKEFLEIQAKALQQRDIEIKNRENTRRRQEAEVLAVNEAILEAQQAQRELEEENKRLERKQADLEAENCMRDALMSKEARNVSAARIRAALDSQIEAKNFCSAAQQLAERNEEALRAAAEEERRRKALAALNALNL